MQVLVLKLRNLLAYTRFGLVYCVLVNIAPSLISRGIGIIAWNLAITLLDGERSYFSVNFSCFERIFPHGAIGLIEWLNLLSDFPVMT